jgi:hypothetical protein
VIMRNLRCLLEHHWNFGIGPSNDHVVLTCSHCRKITVVAAEPAVESMRRIADLELIGHHFDARGRPR